MTGLLDCELGAKTWGSNMVGSGENLERHQHILREIVDVC